MRDYLDVIHKRKSIRTFSSKPVSREIIEKILDVAVYAPTNCNQQLWNFIVIESAETKERLIKEAASNTLLRRAPSLLVLTYDGWHYKEAIQGASLALGNILQAAEYYGVGALPMNSYGSDKKVAKILSIPDHETICCFVALGYPDEKAESAPVVARKSAKPLTHWGKFEELERPPFSYNPEDWTRETLVAHQQYYSRKTYLGKEMDMMSSYERALVRSTLLNLKGEVTDLFTYDGAYIREFPQSVNLHTVDLCKETSEYTEAAANLANRQIEAEVLSDDLKSETATIIFKLERLNKDLRQKAYAVPEKELIIIARKPNLFLSAFFIAIRVIFGPDIRKTGIYNFFGPYKPINLSKIIKELRVAGYREISWHGYFPIPTFYDQIWQMFRQYIASDGSSYLHRERREDPVSKLLAIIMKIQGFIKFGRLGSVVVIKCRK